MTADVILRRAIIGEDIDNQSFAGVLVQNFYLQSLGFGAFIGDSLIESCSSVVSRTDAAGPVPRGVVNRSLNTLGVGQKLTLVQSSNSGNRSIPKRTKHCNALFFGAVSPRKNW